MGLFGRKKKEDRLENDLRGANLEGAVGFKVKE